MDTTGFDEFGDPIDPRFGRVFAGRYEIRRRIARGSMGVVYEAEQRHLGRPVAVKVLDARAAHVASQDVEARFLREASLLSRLNHPNTVRVYDYGVEDGVPFLVMELVRGVTLAKLLSRGPMNPVRALRIAQQVCGSLHEAHRSGMVHRDLKPANVLVTLDHEATDLVKVVDFGLVKEFRSDVELTDGGLMLGTPQYMAPEQILGLELDQRCDVYALGMLLFRSVSGQYPMDTSNPATILNAQLKVAPRRLDELDHPVHLPDVVQWTLDRCLAKHRDERFRDARELQRALRLCEAALLDEGTLSLAKPVFVQGRVEIEETAEVDSRENLRAVSIMVGLAAAVLLVMLLGTVSGYLAMTQFGAGWFGGVP